jgi:hypothetical protein
MKKTKRLLLKLGLVAVLAITAIWINSCKKNTTSVKPFSEDNTKQQITTWLLSQKKDTLTSVAINTLSNQLAWQTAHAVVTDSVTYLIVKVTTEQQKFTDPAKQSDKYLVVINNNNDHKVKDGYLFDIFGDANDIAKNADEFITKGKGNLNIAFTGNLTKLTILNNFVELRDFSAGTMTKYETIVSRPHKNSVVIQSTKK